MNLSESVFIFPPHDRRAHYRARIFTGRREIPFAGHPTIAAAFAFATKHEMFHQDRMSVVVQECGVGIVEIEPVRRHDGLLLFVAQRNPRYTEAHLRREEMARALGCRKESLSNSPVAVVSTGVPWLIIELRDLAAIRSLCPDFGTMAQMSRALKAVGVTVFTRETSNPQQHVHLRSFAPAEGIYEDPVCGSCHGALAAYLSRHCPQIADLLDRGEPLRLEQGDEIGLPGSSEVIARKSSGETRFLVGGASVVTLRGTMHW